MSLTIFGHRITWLETKNFLREVAASAGYLKTADAGGFL